MDVLGLVISIVFAIHSLYNKRGLWASAYILVALLFMLKIIGG